MSEVCEVTMKVWQRKDGRWSGEAKLVGPGKRRTKITHRGYMDRAGVEAVLDGDVNELVNGMGWERQDEQAN